MAARSPGLAGHLFVVPQNFRLDLVFPQARALQARRIADGHALDLHEIAGLDGNDRFGAGPVITPSERLGRNFELVLSRRERCRREKGEEYEASHSVPCRDILSEITSDGLNAGQVRHQ